MKVTAEGIDVTGPHSPVHEISKEELATLEILGASYNKRWKPGSALSTRNFLQGVLDLSSAGIGLKGNFC